MNQHTSQTKAPGSIIAVHGFRYQVKEVARAVATIPPEYSWPYEFHVIPDKQINAFALPALLRDRGPGRNKFEFDVSADALKVAHVIRDQHAAGFATGEREQHVVREGLGDAGKLKSFFHRHRRQHIARAMPRSG